MVYFSHKKRLIYSQKTVDKSHYLKLSQIVNYQHVDPTTQLC